MTVSTASSRIAGVDPIALFARSGAFADRFLWIPPGDAAMFCGLGRAWTLEATGAGRFADAARAWRDHCAALGGEAPAPLAVGGFAFGDGEGTGIWSGFPAAQLVVPELLLAASQDETHLITNGSGTSRRDPGDMLRTAVEAPSAVHADSVTMEERTSASRWKGAVRSLTEAIRGGRVEKVVLAREVRLHAARSFDLRAVLERLRADNPGCYVFAVARGDACFLGATPERLARLDHGEILTTSLAGSAPRGSTPVEDARWEAALRASAKDRLEHDIVVRALRRDLSAVAQDIAVDLPGDVVKLAHVQHLRTTVRARPREGVSVLDVAGALQPTPALGGAPREAALREIAAHEEVDRGWYGGSVGWVDGSGEGEFAVAIRCALVRGSTASLFSGCGIVADSDPDREYEESVLKLQPMLRALTGVGL